MDTTTADDISRLLNQYRTAIHETRDHASERCSFGRFRAGAPYFARHALQLLTSTHGDRALFTPAFEKEFERVNADLALLEHEGGRAYREELFCDLIAYTEAFRTILCYRELGMCDTDGIDDVREEIAVLLDELEGEFRTDTIRALVSSLDETSLSLREADTAKPERSETPAPAGELPSSFYLHGKRTGIPEQ